MKTGTYTVAEYRVLAQILSKTEISQILLDVSLTTVKAEPGALVEGGTIQRIETGRVSNSSKA